MEGNIHCPHRGGWANTEAIEANRIAIDSRNMLRISKVLVLYYRKCWMVLDDEEVIDEIEDSCAGNASVFIEESFAGNAPVSSHRFDYEITPSSIAWRGKVGPNRAYRFDNTALAQSNSPIPSRRVVVAGLNNVVGL